MMYWEDLLSKVGYNNFKVIYKGKIYKMIDWEDLASFIFNDIVPIRFHGWDSIKIKNKKDKFIITLKHNDLNIRKRLEVVL